MAICAPICARSRPRTWPNQPIGSSAAVAVAPRLSVDRRPARAARDRAAVVLPAGITGPQIMRALQDQRCTIMIAVPRLYEAMLAGIERQIAGAPRSSALRCAACSSCRLGAPPPGPTDRQGVVLPCAAGLARRCGCSPRAAPGSSRGGVAPRRARLGSADRLRSDRDLPDPDLQSAGPGPHRKRRPGGRGSNCASARPRMRSRAMAKSWPRARTCSPAIGTIPRLRRKHSPRTASFALAISAGSTSRLPVHRRPEQGADHSLRRREHLSRGRRAVYGTAAQAREVAVLERDNRLVALFVPDPEAQRARSQAELQQHFRGEVERLSRSCRHTPASAISRSRVSRCRAPRSASCAGTSCPRSSSRRRRARAGRSRRRR